MISFSPSNGYSALHDENSETEKYKNDGKFSSQIDYVYIDSYQNIFKGEALDLNSLEDRLAGYGSGGYFLLETFVIELLRADANNNEFHTETKGHRMPFDAYAPKGIGEIHIPLAIEITSTLSPHRINSIIEIHKKFKRSEEEGLLIVSLRSTDKNSSHITKLTQINGTPVFIWDQSHLQKLVDKHLKTAERLSENLFSVRLKMTVTGDIDDWKSKRETIISEVVEKFRDGRLSLFLGAGVSSSAGLPSWDTLLNRLFVSMLTPNEESADKGEHINSIVQRLRQIDGPSALTLARYIRKGMSAGSGTERNQFIESVTTQLYELRDRRFSLASELIREIVSLCAPTRSGAKVRAVITYNFDDLLERVLRDRDIAYRTIFEEQELAEPEELPVYHVHGFLPENRSEYSNLDRSTLVFSEEGYHKIYRDAYHWSNLIQLNSLKETSCLMIGLSLTDPNLRRLLEISTKTVDKPRHFAFLKRVGYDEFTKRSKDDKESIVRAPTKMIRDFLNGHHKLNEEVLRELGVSVIWYEGYDEIPAIVKRMRKII